MVRLTITCHFFIRDTVPPRRRPSPLSLMSECHLYWSQLQITDCRLQIAESRKHNQLLVCIADINCWVQTGVNCVIIHSRKSEKIPNIPSFIIKFNSPGPKHAKYDMSLSISSYCPTFLRMTRPGRTTDQTFSIGLFSITMVRFLSALQSSQMQGISNNSNTGCLGDGTSKW